MCVKSIYVYCIVCLFCFLLCTAASALPPARQLPYLCSSKCVWLIKFLLSQPAAAGRRVDRSVYFLFLMSVTVRALHFSFSISHSQQSIYQQQCFHSSEGMCQTTLADCTTVLLAIVRECRVFQLEQDVSDKRELHKAVPIVSAGFTRLRSFVLSLLLIFHF